jgi:hypothetical protein
MKCACNDVERIGLAVCGWTIVFLRGARALKGCGFKFADRRKKGFWDYYYLL